MKPLRFCTIRDALIVAPHPDDEAIGAFGLIRALRLRGVRVRIVVVTDGAASHPGSRRWPRRRLIAERRHETRRAMRRVGVFAGGITHLELSDGRAAEHPDRRWRGLRRAIGAIRAPGLLVLPDCSDDHSDHRAAADRARLAPTRGVRRLSYLVWPAHRHALAGPTLGCALGSRRVVKAAAIRSYRTQTGAITDDPRGFSISARDLARFARPVEAFRELAR